MQFYSREKRELKILSIISFLLMTGAFVSSFLGVGGLIPPEKIVERYHNLVLPHPYTAGIGALLILFLLYFVIFQTGKPGYGAKKDAMEMVAPLFIFSCLLSAAWILCWSLNLVWATLPLILLLAITTNLAYFKVSRVEPYLYNDERKGLVFPISFFLAFTMNMTVINLTVFIKYMNWDIFGVPKPILAVLAILLLVVVNAAYILLKRDRFFSLVGVVLMAGITAARYLENEIMPVGYLAGVATFFLLVISLTHKRKNINRG